MAPDKIDRVRKHFEVNHGLLTTSELRSIGVSSRNIRAMLDAGMMGKVKHGHYVWAEKADYLSDVHVAAKLIPQGVVCLFTAVEHYGLSAVNPSAICMALPRDANIPKLPSSPPVKIYRMTRMHFELGISQVMLNGFPVRMYDMEKTVCDCFKYDGDMEKSVALEVLKNYIAKGNCNVQKLLAYAKIMGKKKTILPYLEAVL